MKEQQESKPKKPNILVRLIALLVTAALLLGALVLVVYRDRLNLDALARSRAEEGRAFLLKHGPGLGKRVNIASKGGLPDVRSGTAQVEIQLR